MIILVMMQPPTGSMHMHAFFGDDSKATADACPRICRTNESGGQQPGMAALSATGLMPVPEKKVTC